MTRSQYREALLRLYLEQPDTPAAPRRSDWAIADDLYAQGIPLATLAYAIRIATLRRLLRDPEAEPLQPIRSLAYYREVLKNLTPEELDPDYVAAIDQQHARLLGVSKTRSDRQNPALFDRR